MYEVSARDWRLRTLSQKYRKKTRGRRQCFKREAMVRGADCAESLSKRKTVLIQCALDLAKSLVVGDPAVSHVGEGEVE